MKQYLDILSNVLNNGKLKKNRTGVDAISLSGVMFKHNLNDGFPLLTTKFVSLKNIAIELEFFIKGLSDKKWLQDRGCHIWDSWGNPKKVDAKLNKYMSDTVFYALSDIYHKENNIDMENTLQEELKLNDEEYLLFKNMPEFKKYLQKNEMDLGPIYGVNWNNWTVYEKLDESNTYSTKSINQLESIISTLKSNPFDRRMIVSSWNYNNFESMALPPCHYSFQVVSDGVTVDLLFNMRSVDVFLGLSYNIASYALLLILIAKEVNMIPGDLVGFLADTHVYTNHIEQAKTQLLRTPFPLPKVSIPNETNIFNWEYTNIAIENYKHYEKITAPVAI